MPSYKEKSSMKQFLSLIGIGTLALLVAVPANAKIIDKNKAFTACKNEVKSEYLGANRYSSGTYARKW